MRMSRTFVYISDARKQETHYRCKRLLRASSRSLLFAMCQTHLIFTVGARRDRERRKETQKIVRELSTKRERGESSPSQWRRVPLISSITWVQVPHLSLEEDDYLSV